MTTMITELYDAFREAGVSDDKAKAAAAVIGLEHAATKTDLAELIVELIRTLWLQAGVIIGALSLVFGGIATLIKVL
jgi:hypothetical protein